MVNSSPLPAYTGDENSNAQNSWKPFKIILPSETVALCETFANDVLHTNLSTYKRRNQSNPKKITEQIITGKLGEFAFAQFLNSSEPDLKIYGRREKSFGPDLTTQSLNVHVKSQSKEQADKYGVSWVFQVEDPLFKNATDKDFLGLCVVEKTSVYIYDFLPVSRVKDLLKEPKLPQLRFTKRVLYWDDLAEIVLHG